MCFGVVFLSCQLGAIDKCRKNSDFLFVQFPVFPLPQIFDKYKNILITIRCFEQIGD